jgi:hypothetical protein
MARRGLLHHGEEIDIGDLESEPRSITAPQYWHIPLTAVASVQIGNCAHWHSDSENSNGIQ